MNPFQYSKTSGPASTGDLVGALILSYLAAIALIAALIHAAGVWNFLAISRILDPLIAGGVVQYHDMQQGFVKGIPALKYYLMSQDPIDWRLVLIAALLFLAHLGVKSLQFHGVARLYGIAGRFGDHARAFLYAQGLNRWLPFHIGEVGSALTLRGQGVDMASATAAGLSARLFTLFEILFFAIIGLLVLGWSIWLGQIFWALVILAVVLLVMYPYGSLAAGWGQRGDWSAAMAALVRQPVTLARLFGLSLMAFALEHVAVYLLAMAFTSDNVILGIEFSMLLMALVAGFLARLVPLTPGGIGQFEWGFATALYLGGVGMPEAASMAILFSLLRYGVGGLTDLVLLLFYPVDTDTSTVLAASRGEELARGTA